MRIAVCLGAFVQKDSTKSRGTNHHTIYIYIIMQHICFGLKCKIFALHHHRRTSASSPSSSAAWPWPPAERAGERAVGTPALMRAPPCHAGDAQNDCQCLAPGHLWRRRSGKEVLGSTWSRPPRCGLNDDDRTSQTTVVHFSGAVVHSVCRLFVPTSYYPITRVLLHTTTVYHGAALIRTSTIFI